MKEARLIHDGSVCQGDIIDGIDTVAQLREVERQDCRFLANGCPVLRSEGPYCIAKAGQQVARYVERLGTTVEAELRDFDREAPMPAKGYFDPTVEDPSGATTDRVEIVARVGKWAEKVLGVNTLDAASHNRVFVGTGSFSILGESICDEETGAWMHSCGTRLASATVTHSLHLRAMPLAGFGEVQREEVPFCPSCQKAPNPNGEPRYIEDIEAREAEALRKMHES